MNLQSKVSLTRNAHSVCSTNCKTFASHINDLKLVLALYLVFTLVSPLELTMSDFKCIL